MSKLKIGDVIEIPTVNGFAYAQYSHEHEQYGSLLRVYSHTYKDAAQNKDIADLVQRKSSFSCFFPLKSALNKNIFAVVGNYKLCLENETFPIFRTAMIRPDKNTPNIWWLWDGVKEWRIGELTEEQRKLPIRGIWNDTLLIERIESGWLPEKDTLR